MKKFRTSLIVAIAIGLLAGSAFGVTAQDQDPMAPATVTGTINGFEEVEGATTGSISSGFIREEVEERGQLEMSDSRLTGTWTGMVGIDRYSPDSNRDGLAETYSGTVTVENTDGTWVGTMFGCSGCGLTEEESDYTHVELVGTGAYEGLSALLYAGDVWYGVIFPGDIPSSQ